MFGNTLLMCFPACDRACKDTCSGPGPASCDECADGYVMDESSKCRGEGGGGEFDTVKEAEFDAMRGCRVV